MCFFLFESAALTVLPRKGGSLSAVLCLCDLQVYRRNLEEFMDVLLKRGRFKDSDDTKDEDGVSEWAPRQFLCPITQVSTVVAQLKRGPPVFAGN